MAKLWQTDQLLGEVADACLQLFGGYGYMLEYPITRAYMDARMRRIHAGTDEIMKVIIAKQMGCRRTSARYARAGLGRRLC